MRTKQNLLAFLFLLIGVSAHAQNQKIQDKADYLCHTLLNQKDFDYPKHFSPEFIAKIPEGYMKSIVSDLVGAMGFCATTEWLQGNEKTAKYKFVSPTLRYVTLDFSISDSNLIDGLMFRGLEFPDVVINSWQDVLTYSKSLEGRTAVSIQNFSKTRQDGKDELAIQPIGSGFKLYVLGELADQVKSGKLNWQQNFPIKAEWKSLPSGVMQDWENGKEVSLKTFADYMIMFSDNTATDHLMNILGRSEVESQLSLMKNSFESRNRPFLTTAEMFKIKWASPLELIDSFIFGDEAAKRKVLENEIAATPLEMVGSNGVSMETPSFIQEIEWFASTNDLCQGMKSLKEKNSPEILDSLSKNVPNLTLGQDSAWAYGGYKGGSEPGVITMTYLLRHKNSEWGCVSLAWHNEKQVVNTFVFSDFVGKVLKLAEGYF